jgi:peptidyl-prolyl cis-trans isomerase D
MLSLMRKYASTWMIKMILGAIVVVFVFWGVGSYRAQRASRVAVVNGQSILISEYQQAYNNILEQLRQSFGKNLDDNIIEQFQVKQQAINGLIDQKLLLQEADKLNFNVSDKNLSNAIRKIAGFQRNGIFDRQLYQRMLNSNRLTPEAFEEIQRNAMQVEKIRRFIIGSIKVSESEIREWFNWQNAAVNIRYALFKPESSKTISFSDEEINAFFNKNKSNYKTEEKRKARFVRLDPEDFRSRVKLVKGTVADYYESNLEEFKTPKTVEARHILLKVHPEDKPEVVEGKHQKSLEILKMARDGKDFAELAKQYSEGPSKDVGGKIGPFKKEEMVAPFAEQAFSMNPGEISEPVKTRFGWHIIKVEKINEADTITFEDAKASINKKLTGEEARSLAYDLAESIYEVSFEGDDLIKAAEEKDLNVMTTKLFTKQGSIDNIADRSKFISTAFGLPVMSISDIQELSDGYYILQVIETESSEIPQLDAVVDRVEADLIKQKKDDKAKTEAEALFAALKAGKEIDDALKDKDVVKAATGFFQRNDSIPEVGYEPEISSAAFALSQKNKVPANVIKGQKGYYVIQFIDRKLPDPKEMAGKKENIEKLLLQQKSRSAFSAWLAKLKSHSEISIEENFIQ